eukprot:TRINITY_DN2781_c0_g1_i1.p2 TRINITY_DN2781_c0_g1~~TRINITY_DN2781_c0_g1_i1.p2  ORF type:complete len:232 (+),score=57.16 TRINITY_DN2781_c0_g1_i1:82-777(+)
MAGSRTLVASAVAAAGLKLAAGINLRKASNSESALPFDCYVENGADYIGLKDISLSGRKCQNWLNVEGEPYGATVKGIGNHKYCRNPEGSKDKPWCYTVDPAMEWEYCEVPECQASAVAPEAWVAPEGSKSEAASAEGPCEPKKSDHAGFTEYKAGRACMDNRGETWWLISNERSEAADPEACKTACSEMPGTEYFTFYAGAAEGKCGCYRECILVDESLTVDDPTVYKVD